MPDAMELSEARPAPQLAGCEVRGLTRVWFRRGGPQPAGMPLVARVLAARGLADAATARAFLEPSLSQLHDPSLIPDLDKAADRLLAAARGGEAIVIYGDYDVDGISATAILFHTLRAVAPAAAVTTYVPHRLEEGYGLNSEAVRELARLGAKVIVSVDCGITAVAPALVSREVGVDLIITDHHNPPETMAALPAAYAVVHPRRPDSAYPFGDLCGAGVAFKLAWRLCTRACASARVTEELRTLLLELLALTSLGVIADVVPLVGENRVIAAKGLARIKHSAIPGLRALVEASGLGTDKVEAEDVGFRLAPRLNACGRMGHAREAVELLTAADGPRATAIAVDLTRLNDERRVTERAIFEQALGMAQAAGMTRPDRRAIVLSHPDWHAGVVGIVCSRLVERFHRPAILLARHDGVCHGSGRSIDRFNLHAGLQRCAAHLTTFGGHDMAAGLKLPASGLDAFADAFIAVANEAIPPEALIGTCGHDGPVSVGELGIDAVTQLRRLGPFGRANPDVRLVLEGVRVAQRPETFGNGNKHLCVRVSDARAGLGGAVLRLTGWNWAERISSVPPGATIDALIAPKINRWNGRVTVEADLIDLRPLG